MQPIEFILDDTLLGEGTFSLVHLAKNSVTNEYVAAKILDLSKNRLYYEKEVRALTVIHPHKNIVKLVQYGEDGNTGYIFTQFVQPKTLLDFMNDFGGNGIREEEALGILDQLVDGVSAIHADNFSHNDLKLDNVLYNPYTKTVHIFDFGLSTEPDRTGAISECCGSPLYMAPEVLTQTPRHNPMLSDIWSLGIIFYYLLVGDLPWLGVETLQDLVAAVLAGRLYIPRHMSRDARVILAGMLQLTPTTRWSLPQIKKYVRNVLSRALLERNDKRMFMRF